VALSHNEGVRNKGEEGTMIRIVIAEKQHLLLGTLGSLLNLEDDMKVVGQSSDGEEALTLVEDLKPDVFIMDIDIFGENNLYAANRLMKLGCTVILLATFARKSFVEPTLDANVRGYLLKDSPSDILVTSIRHIMDGYQILAPELMEEEEMEEIVQREQDCAEPKNIQHQVKAYIHTLMEKMKQPTG
jgi:two-component system, NarL family, response regulator DesR